MESVPSESLMSLLKSTIENWLLGERKNWLCLQERANGGELVSIVVHLIDREPTCTEIPQEQLIIIMKGAEIFIRGISWSETFHCTCHLSRGRCLITLLIRVCVCVSVHLTLFSFLLYSALTYKIKIKLSISVGGNGDAFLRLAELSLNYCRRGSKEKHLTLKEKKINLTSLCCPKRWQDNRCILFLCVCVCIHWSATTLKPVTYFNVVADWCVCVCVWAALTNLWMHVWVCQCVYYRGTYHLIITLQSYILWKQVYLMTV